MKIKSNSEEKKKDLQVFRAPASPTGGIINNLMSYRELSNYLNISVRKIQEFVQNKQLQCVKIGRSVRFDADSIRQFIEERKGY